MIIKSGFTLSIKGKTIFFTASVYCFVLAPINKGIFNIFSLFSSICPLNGKIPEQWIEQE